MTEEARPSLARRAVALLVLVVAAWILLKVVIGIVAALSTFIVVVLAIVAVVWALRTLQGAVGGAVYLVIALFFGLAGGMVGRLKGSSFLLWFLISAVLPVLGLAGALLYRFETEELRRQCPGCGRVCMLYDAICTRCGMELEFPDVAVEPEGSARYHQGPEPPPAALSNP